MHVKTYKIYEFVIVGSKYLQLASHMPSTYNLPSPTPNTPSSNYFNHFFNEYLVVGALVFYQFIDNIYCSANQ